MGIETIPHPSYSRDLASCEFWLFRKLRGCRYDTIEEMKEALTKVIDTLKQEDFHGAHEKFFERYNKWIAVRGDYFEGDNNLTCVLSTKVPIRKKSGKWSLVCVCFLKSLVYVQLLKANMDQQQKIEERHKKLLMELHNQQLEFQQFTLQKTELQQKQLEEFLVNSLNASKNLKKTRYFPRVQSMTRLIHSNTYQRTSKRSRLFTVAMKIFSTYTVNNGLVKERYVYY